MIKYIIVSETSIMNLEMNVLRNLSDGWELQGGVSVVRSGGMIEYCQAMIYRNNSNGGTK